MTDIQETVWPIFQREASATGLNLCLVVDREAARPAFDRRGGPGLIAPQTHFSDYRTAVVLGSGGRRYWEAFQAAPEAGDGRPDPLDRFSTRAVDALAEILRRVDPAAVSAFPFRYPRQVIPFLGLVEHTGLNGPTPFGVSIHPAFGPWFAWRGVILSGVVWPATPVPATSPCEGCPAPCLGACPADAAALDGLKWESCLAQRRREGPCQLTCAARTACIVGPEHRYSEPQSAYHGAASLREILAME